MTLPLSLTVNRCSVRTLFLIAVSCFAAGIQPSARAQSQQAAGSVEPLKDGLQIQAASQLLRVTALRDDIVRVRIAAAGPTLPEDASWAVLPDSRTHSIEVKAFQEANAAGFRTGALEVRVELSPLRLIVSDLSGNVLSADALGQPVEFARGGFAVHKEMAANEHFYGLGDKAGSFDRREQAYSLWNTDVAPQESTDPLYKSIPFFLGIREGRSYGLFLDNTWRTWFDFGKQYRDAYSFGAEGGPLDYYILYGPTPKEVVEGYAYLTGTPPLPPLWSLGFQQSRYSYTPESQVREVTGKMRADKIPADVIYMDIDYQIKNRPFTVDPGRFPGFPGFVADLKKQHFHLVLITDLHVAHVAGENYMPYETGHAGDHFVKKPDGSEFVGIVWPGDAVFPDFTRAQTRDWWGGLYKEFAQQGVAGFWNDMNEPSVFDGPTKTMPLDNVHRIDEPGFAPRTATHAEIHNVLGMENQRATYDGLVKLRPDERPFVLTRATYAGGQRYGFTWTGDNSATWNHLRLATQMLMNLGLSGVSFVGDDIGGFNGSPQPDLLTKWIEIGAFNPLFRDHTTKGSLPQEVWVHGPQQEAIRRRYIEVRYRLLPYIYTLAEEASRTGVPLVRPVFLEFPETVAPGAPGFDGMDSEFLLGPDLLIAPSSFPDMLDDYTVSYPQGPWFDLWTGKKVPAPPPPMAFLDSVKAGPDAKIPEPAKIHPSLETLPVYVRGGSILPLQPLVQSTDETPSGPLELRVYPGPRCNGSLYMDDGHSFRYKNGEFLRQSFSCEADGKTVHVKFEARTGSYAPWWKTIEVVVYDWPTAQAEARISGSSRALKTSYDAGSKALHISIPDVSGVAELKVGGAE